MAVNPPPIQEKTTDQRTGLFPQAWIRWFYDLSITLNGSLAWFDYNNSASGTPINHTGGGTTYLTNDGAGSFSNEYNTRNIRDVWDSSSNEFDFTGLEIGSVVFFRFDVLVDFSVNNQEVNFILDLAIGSGSDYSLTMHYRYDKSFSTTKHITFVYEIYIGNNHTKDYPAKVRFDSDDDADVYVNGWYVRVINP